MQNADIQKYFDKKIQQAERWVKKELPRRVGNEAVRHFKENFRQEGFVNNGLQKWKDVKRRDPNSPWYGFMYKGEKRTSYAFKRSKKTGKTYKLKQQKKLNFSQAATRWKILHNTGELQDSLQYVPNEQRVLITSDKPYAGVQNSGGPVKIFGRKTVMLPARPFVGDSKELKEKIEKIIRKGLDTVFQK